MEKRAYWTITLLLAAVVPFATGCNSDPCKTSADGAKLVDKLTFKMDKAVERHDLSFEACNHDLLSVADLLYSKRNEIVSRCKGDECTDARTLKIEIENLQQSVADACDSTNNGGVHPGGYDNNSESTLTLRRLRNAREAIIRMDAPGTSIMTQVCSPKELLNVQKERDAALDALKKQESANTTTTPVPSMYLGNDAPPRDGKVAAPGKPANPPSAPAAK